MGADSVFKFNGPGRKVCLILITAFLAFWLGAVSPLVRHVNAETHWTITELLDIINSPSNEVNDAQRNIAIQEIGNLGTKEAAEALTALMSGRHRFMTALCLGQLKAPEAVPVLVAHLDVKDPFYRACLCNAIGNIGGDGAVDAMIAIAKNDSDAFVRRSAVHALRLDADNRPDGPAMPALCELLEMETVMQDVVAELFELSNRRALSRLEPALSSEAPLVRGVVCVVIKRHGTSEYTDALIALIEREQNRVVLGKAIVALAAVHPPERAGEVADQLGRFLKNDALRELTVEALRDTVSGSDHLDVRLGEILGPLLLPALKSEKSSQRHAAAKIYRKLRYGPAAPRLIELIRKEEDMYIREDAMCALAISAQTRSHVDFMFDWQARYPDDDSMVQTAISLLDTSVALPSLIAVLRKTDDLNTYTVIPVLGRMGNPDAAQPLLDFIAAGKRPCDKAAEALRHVAGKGDVARMAEILKQGPCARTELAQALLHADRLNGLKQIRQLINSKDEASMQALHAVLERWHALPGDEPLLSAALKTEDPFIRMMAVQAMGRLAGPVAGESICTAFRHDPDSGVRTEAANVMATMHNDAAIQCLADGYAVSSMDANLIGLNETTHRALCSVTGQRFDGAAQWQAWVRDGMGLGKEIESCIEAMADDNRALRVLAANRIADWPDKQEQFKALPFILRKIEAHAGSDAELMAWARMLAHFQEPAVRDRMLEVCRRSTSLDIRGAFARSLYALGDERGVETLLRCLENDQGCPEGDDFALLETVAVAAAQSYNYSADHWKRWWRKRQLAAGGNM